MNGNSHYVAGQMRLKLQELLDEKERQLQQAGALGQRILAQQVELEERINQISELDGGTLGNDDDAQSDIRTKLDDLAATMHQWATENDTLWNGFSPKDAASEQQQIPQFEEETEQPVSAGPSAVQSSRRAKNAAHRAKDVEFAYEIGSSLLTEVRRLQSLLAERDKSLQDMKEEKDDLERSLDSLRVALRTQEANADKYKEENWNLEVSLQELRSQLSEAQGNAQRTETENKRTLRQIAQIQKTADDHKNEAERLANLLEDVRAKHETDVAQMRKQQATLQREKVDLQTDIDSLKAEMTKKTKTIGRFGSPMTPNDPKFLTPGPTEYVDEEDDLFGTAASNRRKMDSSLVFTDAFGSEIASSPDVSPIKSPIPNQAASELEALKQSLAHAHRQIGTLKNSLMREKQLRTDYSRKLTDMGTSVAEPSDEDDYEDEPGELPRVTPLRRGRGRARVVTRGNRMNNNIAQKLALAAKSGPSEPSNGPELPLAEFSTTQDPEAEWVNLEEGADEYAIENYEDPQDDDEQKRMSMLSVTSIDGMDPAFANILKQSHDAPASGSSHPIESKRSRGGAPFRRGESRPGSILNAPSALAAELGMNEEEAQAVPEPVVIREDMGIQCDLLLPPAPSVQSTIAIQTDVITVDTATQTSQITTEEASVSTEPAQLRSYADASAITDAQPNAGEELKDTSGIIMTAHSSPHSSPLVPTARQPPSSYKSPENLANKHDTDTEDETEYEDARETVTGTTPAESIADLHSVDSFVDGSSDSDAESIKVSRLHVKRPSGPAQLVDPQGEVVATRALKDTVVDVKPVSKEAAAQTEEWTPPIPPGTALFAVGPQAQQFQFIASPNLAGSTPTSPTLKTQQEQLRTSSSNTALSDVVARSRAPSGTLSVIPSPKVDRSRPPTMILPPPPRLPPPPPGAIKAGPPNMGPPPRPTSPPPSELVQRATTPTISRNSTLVVPIAARGGTLRQSSTVSSSALTRQGKSNHVGQDDASNHDPFDDNAVARSMPSLTSSRRSVSSRRMSISSSISSDHAIRMLESPAKMGASTPGAASAGEPATDPTVIHAITQTMIGEYLYKYTRKTIGKGHAERRHRRYFWIHPYTKTIYWSSVDPGASNVTESSAKSAYIESVKAVMDPNPMPPGLHQYSVVVTTANREMKFTAPTKERHDIWYNALNYLLTRPPAQQGGPIARAPLSPTASNQPRTQNEESTNRRFDQSPQSQRSVHSGLAPESPNTTPKMQRSQSRMSNPYGSVGKKSGTAAAEYLRWNEPPTSPTAIQHSAPDTEFHIHDNHDAAYDGLENVRACCDGKHDVGNLSSRHHHHPSHHNQYHQGTVRSTSDALPDRPGSPSGWSFRSSRSKGGSQEGGAVFSWSRRSRKGSAVRP